MSHTKVSPKGTYPHLVPHRSHCSTVSNTASNIRYSRRARAALAGLSQGLHHGEIKHIASYWKRRHQCGVLRHRYAAGTGRPLLLQVHKALASLCRTHQFTLAPTLPHMQCAITSPSLPGLHYPTLLSTILWPMDLAHCPSQHLHTGATVLSTSMPACWLHCIVQQS